MILKSLSMLAGAITMVCAASAAGRSAEAATQEPSLQVSTARAPVTWLLFVDDLHLDFRNTGRLRDLLRRISRELLQEGDHVAARSTGPSSLSLDVTQDRSRLAQALKNTSGNALKPSDLDPIANPGVAREVSYRLTTSLLAARNAIEHIAQAPEGLKALIYISNGYDVGPAQDQVMEVARLAKDQHVTVFAIDPRGISAAGTLDALLDPPTWQVHLSTTRESLRMLSEPTGGFLIFELTDVAPGLKRIGDIVRR